ncbi:uncharacterized protein LOC135217024 [Macrobrachium nipponense]|uniref:uncharacterized protein LOC135217024 n=1 Tax=Macrobrachium nipponense TaxID=159736 RepID=UPI0030C7D50A
MKQLFNGETTLCLAVLMSLSTLGHGLRVSGIGVPSVVTSGSTVKLMCSYDQRKDRDDPLYSLKWYRGVDQFYEYMPGKVPPVRVYPLPNLNVDKKQSDKATVVLTGVTKDTSGTFRCEVVGDKPHFETDDYAENMTVLEVPQWGPKILNVVQSNIGNRVRPGDEVHAQCEVGPSDPPVTFLWSLNGNPPPPHAGVWTAEPLEDVVQPQQTTELRMIVTEDSFKRGAMTLTCEVTLSSVYQRSAHLTLLHADHKQAGEFGWFSSGSSIWFSLVLVEATMGALCLLLIC